MSSRTFVRALHRTLTVSLVVAICASQVSIALAGNYRIGAVGGVVIQIDGVVRNATVDQRAALAKLRREEFKKPTGEWDGPSRCGRSRSEPWKPPANIS